MKTLLLPLAMVAILVACGCKPPLKDFDVVANGYDKNVFPENPKWGAQAAHDTIPTPSVSCPIESDSDNPDDWTKSPQYPNCTNYPVSFTGGFFCGPHVNFMPVTYEGTVVWDDHAFDDDYLFNIRRDDSFLYSTAGFQAHAEFDSDETVDNWDDTGTWWDNFHHNGVDHITYLGPNQWVADGHQYASAMVNGSYAKVIGLLNLDTLHGGKTELHPLFAMLIKLNSSDVRQSSWAFFVRNWGDEGFCSDDERSLETRAHVISLVIPDVAGLISSNVWEGAQNEDDLSPMQASMAPYGDSVLMTFTMLAPEKQSWFMGDLKFIPRPPKAVETATKPAPVNDRTTEAGEFDESPDPASRALLDQVLKLPADAKKELDLQLQTVIPRKKPLPVKLTMLSEPAATQTSPFAPGKVVFHRGVVRGGIKSTAPAHRQKKMEFIKNYLAVHRIK